MFSISIFVQEVNLSESLKNMCQNYSSVIKIVAWATQEKACLLHMSLEFREPLSILIKRLKSSPGMTFRSHTYFIMK